MKVDLPGVGLSSVFAFARNQLRIKATNNGMYLLVERGSKDLRSAPGIRPLHSLVSLAFEFLLLRIKLGVLHHSIIHPTGILLFLNIDLRDQ